MCEVHSEACGTRSRHMCLGRSEGFLDINFGLLFQSLAILISRGGGVGSTPQSSWWGLGHSA